MAGHKQATPDRDPGTAEFAACDCQILVWAFPWTMRPEKKTTTHNQDVPAMRRRAKILMKMLAENNANLCIPTMVVAELLAPIDPAKHPKLIAGFDKHFFCPAFDLRASGLAARLWQFERGLGNGGGGLPHDERSDRRVLKADAVIVATAKVAGATTFYSHDVRCRRLAAEAGMKACDLPTTSGNFLTDMAISEDQDEEDARQSRDAPAQPPDS